MKTTVFLLFLFCAAAVFAQSSPTLTPLEFGDHSYHAGYQSMAQASDILGGSSVVIGHGEVPLADIPMPKIQETPLGDVARQARKDHLTAKKAQKVWESQIFGTKAVQIQR